MRAVLIGRKCESHAVGILDPCYLTFSSILDEFVHQEHIKSSKVQEGGRRPASLSDIVRRLVLVLSKGCWPTAIAQIAMYCTVAWIWMGLGDSCMIFVGNLLVDVGPCRSQQIFTTAPHSQPFTREPRDRCMARAGDPGSALRKKLAVHRKPLALRFPRSLRHQASPSSIA